MTLEKDLHATRRGYPFTCYHSRMERMLLALAIVGSGCGSSTPSAPPTDPHDLHAWDDEIPDAGSSQLSLDAAESTADATILTYAPVENFCAFSDNLSVCALGESRCEAERKKSGDLYGECEVVAYVACLTGIGKRLCFATGWECALLGLAAEDGVCKYSCADGTRACVPSRTTEVVRETRAVKGVVVTVQPSGNLAWTITVENNTKDGIRVVWDESSYVNQNGAAQGRLITGDTAMGDVKKPQRPSPIPSASKASATVYSENAIPRIRHEVLDAEPSASKFGRLSLVIETAKGKKTWEGEVTNTGSSSTP